MQPHSEVPTTTTKASGTTTNNSLTPKTTTTNTAAAAAATKINNNQSPSSCKLVKSCRPLVNFNFYLDIKDHQISKKVEERITELGGNLDFFLTKSVTHFITDRSLPSATTSSKNNNNHNNSPSTGVGVNGGGVGGGGGGGVYPITPSPYLQSPQTPTTPKTPYTNQTYSGDSATDGVVGSSHNHNTRFKGPPAEAASTPNSKKKITRADAMLHRALQSQQSHSSVNHQQQQKQQPIAEEHHKRPNLEYGAYKVWTIEYAIKFLKRVTADVKAYTKKALPPQATVKGACEPIQLKGHFIKIEAITGCNRPYYSVFRNIEWPKIQLGTEGGAFRLTAAATAKRDPKSAKDKPPLKTNAMTRKSRSSSKHNPNHMRLKAKQAPAVKQVTEKPAIVDNNSSEKQCGVCEICKIEYDTLTIHLKTKDHEFFARNQNNYLALDSLIKTSASVDKFLEDAAKDEEAKDEISSLEPMEIDEESSRSTTRKSSRRQSPAPPPPPPDPPSAAAAVIKIKTKLKEVEVDKKPQHNGRKPSKSNNVPLDSPPIRHPLPTSTIYKVVADSKAQTDPVSPKKSSIIVKFRKIRQTELSILNGEAENFMFPRRPTSSERATDSDRQTSTDSNRVSSSSISSESHLTEEPAALVHDRPDSATSAKRRRTTTAADNNHKSDLSVCYQSFPNAPIQPNKNTLQASTITSIEEHPDSKPLTTASTTRRKKRSCVGRNGGRRRRRCVSTNPRNRRRQQRWDSEDRMGDDGNTEDEEEDEIEDDVMKDVDYNPLDSDDSPQKSPKVKKVVTKIPAFDLNQGRIKDQIYAFERLPVNELWYEVFRRQDGCTERMFEYWGSTSYRKLPYELGAMPMRTLPDCKICTPYQMAEIKQEPGTSASKLLTSKRVRKLKKIKKERKSKSNSPEPTATSKPLKSNNKAPHNKHLNKATFLSCDLMPRKSPREHASTLAILSCLIKQRKDSELDDQAPPPPTPPPQSKEKTPEPLRFVTRNNTPEPLQFVSEISENVKRLRRGQKKFDDFVPAAAVETPVSPNAKKRKPGKPKTTGLEFEIDEKQLKSLEAKEKTTTQLAYEIDAYLGRMSMRGLRHTPTLPCLPVQESTSSSGFVDDFTSEVDLIDLIDCYDGGGGGGGKGEDSALGTDNNSICNPLRRPSNAFNLFSAHNRRRKNNKINKTGWPTTRRRNTMSTRQNHLLQKPERFRFFCDYQTRQKHSQSTTTTTTATAVQDGLAPTTATSMTPPDTDLDDKDDECTRSSMPNEPEEEEETSIICKDDILNNSCMSPSEKADNSDIFTVSSDGLDTDLDISCNQIIKTEDIDDECTTSSTIAAPQTQTQLQPKPLPPPQPLRAPTEPQPESKVKVKSPKLTPVMRSIIKREVKVSCKRLRTPFRRFRQHLRKLIKYEESIGVDVHQKDYFDNLYRKTTVSSRAKSDSDAAGEDSPEVSKARGPAAVVVEKERQQRGRAVLREQNQRRRSSSRSKDAAAGRSRKKSSSEERRPAAKSEGRPTSTTRATAEGRPPSTARATSAKRPPSTDRASRATTRSSNRMWIRTRSKTPHYSAHNTRMDPVQLYQYYNQEWQRFKTNLPGEANRSELRWQIRHKLLGDEHQIQKFQTKVYLNKN